ncbi:MAG: LytTR family transcriptional regulator [Colwellia sp.]|nr:LytTR family transcriptional regulator [Colwellia sp.]
MKKIKQLYNYSSERKLLGFFLFAFVSVIAVAIFQDYLSSVRRGGAFFFTESLLFKAFWFYFPPILILINNMLTNGQITTVAKMCIAIFVATLAHLILAPLTIWCWSTIFFDYTYGFYKGFTFTLSNDLLKILIIYTIFIFGQGYLITERNRKEKEGADKPTSLCQYISVNNGKSYTRINLSEIIYIKAATPYVAIQLEKRQYLNTESLKSILKKLDARFIRIHKSSIVNLDKVLSYKSRLNGDYDLMLQDGTEIRLSRNYVNEFKNNFESSPQLNP